MDNPAFRFTTRGLRILQVGRIKCIDTNGNSGVFTATCGAWILAKRGAGPGGRLIIISNDAPADMLDEAEAALGLACSMAYAASIRGSLS